MNAADFTHGMKLAGGNTRMWVGLIVLLALVAVISYWWGDPENRDQVYAGLFGSPDLLPNHEHLT